MSGQGIFQRITRRLMQWFLRGSDAQEDETSVMDIREAEALPPLPMPQRDMRVTRQIETDSGRESPPQMPAEDFADTPPLSYEPYSMPEDVSSSVPRTSAAEPDMNPLATPARAAPLPISAPYSPPRIDFPEPYAQIPQAEAPDYADAVLRRISWDERRYPQSMEDS